MDDLPKCDCHLLGIAWPKSQSCELELRLRNPEGRTETIRFTWVENLSIRLDLPSFVGLTWNAEYVRDGDRIRVHLDFASDGDVTFECGGIEKI
jgi:hypothetical protein